MSLSRLSSIVARNLGRSLSTKNAFLTSKMSSPVSVLSTKSQGFHSLVINGSQSHKCSSTCLCSKRFTGNAVGVNVSDKELSDFLSDEIKAEKQMTKLPQHGPGVPGFDVKTNGSNITLSRKINDETVTVKFNVNGTVDTEGPDDETQEAALEKGGQPETGEMVAKPDFTVEVRKPSGKALVFACRLFGNDEDEVPENLKGEEEKGDQFEIESFGILNKDDIDEFGEWDDNVYLGDGRIIDGQLYDLLMNYLDERGIGVEFAQHLMQFSTHYEHGQYVNLLENVKHFVEGK
ncbi:Complement component 1 Q subcomponent-binding protein, mitochondrial [Halotydeus destructor]|nr:Complement component 1 Q subcomponent-binding protein, mitochondrial [Halotydeus destructor]